jgi:hypothetical protein
MSEAGGIRLEVGLMLSLTVLGVGSRAELAAQFRDSELGVGPGGPADGERQL